MKTNKYLNNLDIAPEHQWMNWIYSNSEFSAEQLKKFSKQIEECRFDERETWSFCDLLVEFIYTHLKMMMDVSNIIAWDEEELEVDDEDLAEEVAHKLHKEEYPKNKQSFILVPVEDSINFILNSCEEWLMARENDWDWDWYFSMERSFQLLGMIFERLWW